MPDSMESPSTQTKPLLHEDPPDKLAPPGIDGFSLVLLERGADRPRVDLAIQSLAGEGVSLDSPCPFVVRRNLTLDDALVGQCELICCDSISVFLRDDVVRHAEPSYLAELYDDLRTAEEFAPVIVHLKSIPDNDEGRQFLRQFFGQFLGIGSTQTVPRKKARIMTHWAARLRVQMECDD